MLQYTDFELQQLLCPETTLEAWTFDGADIREAINGLRLLNPSIDLSSKCNLNCPYCYVEKIGTLDKKRNENELSLTDYKSIIDKLAEAGARTINIVGAGEPTIDPNFKIIAQYIKDIGCNVLVATNGIAIAKSDSLVSFLNNIEASVVLKVNSFTSELQDDLVGQKGYTEYRNAALNQLLKLGFNKKKPTRLGINTLLMKSNFNQIFDIFKFCRENNITLICGSYMPTGRTESSIFQGDYLLEDKKKKDLFEPISSIEYNHLRQKLLEYDNENGFSTISPVAYISGLPCIQGLGIQIDNQGKIWHCPARHQIINGQLESKEICASAISEDLDFLWQNEPYLKRFRYKYNGCCPYKTI